MLGGVGMNEKTHKCNTNAKEKKGDLYVRLQHGRLGMQKLCHHAPNPDLLMRPCDVITCFFPSLHFISHGLEESKKDHLLIEYFYICGKNALKYYF